MVPPVRLVVMSDCCVVQDARAEHEGALQAMF